jgi:thioredoxin reductase (NADPH)
MATTRAEGGGEEFGAADPYARAAQTFPSLPAEVVTRMMPYGVAETVAAGAHLFDRHQRSVDFFLVLAGRIEIFDIDLHEQATILVTLSDSQFTGELDLFNEREILVSGRAAVQSRVLRIRRADFRRMVVAEPDIGEIVMRAFILRRVGLISHAQGGVTLIGRAHASDTLRIQRFLVRNGYPHRLLDTDADPDAGGFLDCFGLTADQLPVVILTHDAIMRNPPTPALADALGLTETIDPAHVYDVAVVGAGPAGLAAAVYAASEGLGTIVIEGVAPGGQAGTSSKIENYLGFPTGISGQALAGRAQVQAQKFGAHLAISRHAVGVDCDGSPFRIRLEDGQTVATRSIIVATGARYRKLDVANYARFEGQGIHYAATAMEARLCENEEVIVVGGGNSAGQAAMFLSRTAAHVHILVRADGLAATMSDYLVQRIENSPRITLRARTEITGLAGDGYLREVEWSDLGAGASETRKIGNIFVMIGAEPNTGWLEGCLALDAKGFVITGEDEQGNPLPSNYMTSCPGIFAVGDVRSGSVKRVASGVGEGSVVVSAVHQYLHPAGA